jgi:outer membrane lipoprotein-sorting protein
MTAEDIKAGLDDLDVQGSFVDYEAKGHTVELKGTEDVEGTECYKLVINRKNSGIQTLFVDKDSYLVIRSVSKRNAMGQEMDVVADMSDYKPVNGVMMPHAISQPGMGTVKISSITINGELPADIFAVK